MNASELVCPNCAASSSPLRIWCERCHASLLPPPNDEPPELLSKADQERKQLYQQVLLDLDQLVQTGEVPSDKSDAIGDFYRNQLSQIAAQEAALAQTASINLLIQSVRGEAQAGHYRDAIKALKAGAQEHPGALPFDSMMAEIVQKASQEEADKLLQQSKECLLSSQFEEAKQKLLEASQLDPNNRSVQVALADIEARLAAKHRELTTPTALPENVDDEILVATLVEPDEASITAAIAEAEVASSSPPSQEAVSPDLPPPTATPEFPASEFPASEFPAKTAAMSALPSSTPSTSSQPSGSSRRSFADEDEIPHPTQRLIDSASQWSTVFKPFLVDNVLWFVGAFLVIAGFVVLIVTFWGNIEQNRILMHSLVYFSLATATGMFFSMAYFMRMKYPQLENSSNVLLVIVALLIPLVFAAAVLTTLVPVAPPDVVIQASMR